MDFNRAGTALLEIVTATESAASVRVDHARPYQGMARMTASASTRRDRKKLE